MNTESRIGLVAGGLLETFNEGYLAKYPFLTDILEFSNGEYNGTKSISEHIARRTRIRANVRMLKGARALLGLSSIEEMEWHIAQERAAGSNHSSGAHQQC